MVHKLWLVDGIPIPEQKASWLPLANRLERIVYYTIVLDGVIRRVREILSHVVHHKYSLLCTYPHRGSTQFLDIPRYLLVTLNFYQVIQINKKS